MPLGTSYISTLTPVSNTVDTRNHVHVFGNLTATQVGTVFSSTAKTPTASFSIVYGKQLISFTKGQAVNVDAGVLAAVNTAYNNSPPFAT